MSAKFISLSPEKQDRILNAASKEFAQKGYDKASTNSIVKEAGIAKGLLFHYFPNKKELFLFLYDHCVGIAMNEFYKKVNLQERDFFIRFRQMQRIKWGLLHQYPDLFSFLQMAYLEESPEVRQELDRTNRELLASATAEIFADIDRSKFKDSIDLNMAINVIIWTFRGLADEVMGKGNESVGAGKQLDYEQAFVKADTYIEMLRCAFYK